MKEKETKDKGFHTEEGADGKKVVVVTDTDLFGEHLENYNKNKKPVEEELEPSDLRIVDVQLNPIHLACTNDDTNPNHRLIEIKHNIASATNGYFLVKIDLSLVSPFTKPMLKILNGKFIHMSVWAEICKCDWLELDDDMIICHKAGINKMFEYSHSQGTFFKMNNIIDEIKEAGEEEKRMMFFDTDLITTIAKIFKVDRLHFGFTQGKLGTLVFPYHGCGMFAVLMGIEDEKVENRYFFT